MRMIRPSFSGITPPVSWMLGAKSQTMCSAIALESAARDLNVKYPSLSQQQHPSQGGTRSSCCLHVGRV
eukprot:3951553-Pyramimonas_sp.AAC.1